MKYDWSKDWYEGELGEEKRSIIRDHPLDALLAFLLGAAVLIWWGVS